MNTACGLIVRKVKLCMGITIKISWFLTHNKLSYQLTLTFKVNLCQKIRVMKIFFIIPHMYLEMEMQKKFQKSKIREDKPAFVEAVDRLYGVTTMHDNQKYSSIIEVICRRNRVLNWWKWWKVRGYHIFPALRGYGWTGSNWAEIGHSTLKTITESLVGWSNCARHSICHNGRKGIHRVHRKQRQRGKGPTVLKKKMNERKAMRAYTQSAADALLHGDITKEIDNYDPEAANFLPKRSGKHSVPKIFSTKNPVEKHLRGKKPTKSRARSPVVEIDMEESEVGRESTRTNCYSGWWWWC